MTQDLPEEPAAVAGAVPSSAAGEDNYEFSDFENTTIERAGKRARLWGIISVVVAALAGVGVLIVGVALLPQSVPIGLGVLAVLIPIVFVHLAMAMYYVKAGNSLLEVVRTSGNDVEHLLSGVGSLTSAFRIEVIVSVVGFVIGLAFAVSAVVMRGGTP